MRKSAAAAAQPQPARLSPPPPHSYINQYFEKLIKEVSNYNGDVIKSRATRCK